MPRLDHAGVVVDDLDTVAASSSTWDSSARAEGWSRASGVDKIVGLDGVRVEMVTVRTPDRSGKLECLETFTSQSVDDRVESIDLETEMPPRFAGEGRAGSSSAGT